MAGMLVLSAKGLGWLLGDCWIADRTANCCGGFGVDITDV